MHINNPTNQNQQATIREDLEQQAWEQNPGLANRLAHYRTHHRDTKKAEQTPRYQSCRDSTRRIMRWQDRVMLTLSIVVLLLIIVRTESASADHQLWGLQLGTGNGTHTELAIDTTIQIDITGLTARVESTQTFTNQSDQWAEGIYRFPLPDGVAVDRMTVKVGERVLEGEIQEKETARRTYQKAREAGQTTSIVEQQRRNQFETRLANIGPGEHIEITLGYLQTVDYRDSSYHLRLPMTFTPRWEPGSAAFPLLENHNPTTPRLVSTSSAGGHSLQLHANLVSAAEFSSIESLYHDVDIRQVENGYRVELLNPDEVTGRDFELSWTPALQSRPSASLTTFNDGESVYAQLMLAPPLADAIAPQAREVILIIDTSGSMEGNSLIQAKSALSHALRSFGEDDYFNLLQFNSNTETLFDQSAAVTPANLYEAQLFISSLKAGGGTDMAPALEAALAMPKNPQLMRQVVFITDGGVGNEADLLKMIAQDLDESRLFTVAIGYAPNSWFMRKAAEIGRGSYIHIGKSDEVQQQMTALWGRIQLPALTDICVNWGDAAEYYPEVIPDLYAGEPLWLFARLPAEPTIISLCGDFNGATWNLDVNGWDAAANGPGGDNLAKLWARKKIEALEDGVMFGADRELTQLEITAVALDFGLLTRHTSLVAVDKTPRRTGAEALLRSEVPGLLPTGGSRHLAGYPATATGWVAQLLLSVFVLLLATSMLVFSGDRLRAPKHTASSQ